MIISNLHKYYNGFCIEFKTPKYNGILINPQKQLLEKYEKNNYKCLVSSDYDEIMHEISIYMQDIRVKCPYCVNRKFKNETTFKNHKIRFHRIKEDKI